MKKQFLLGIMILSLIPLSAQILTPIKWTFQTKNVTDKSADLVFTAQIDDGWHLYGMNIPDGGPKATSFDFTEMLNVKKMGKLTSTSKLIESYDSNFEMQLNWYTKKAVFIQKITFENSNNYYINGEVEYMACNDESCIPPASETFTFGDKNATTIAPVSTKTTPNAVAAQSPTSKKVEKKSAEKVDSKQQQPKEETKKSEPVAEPLRSETPITATENTENKTTDYWTPVIDELRAFDENDDTSNSSSLWWIFLLGFGGGFIALFTPCVWPIIPMTVSFFLKKSEKKKGKGQRDAFLYGFSIIFIYVALGLLITLIFGASALNSLSTSAVFNLIFFAMLIVFAISFFGAFEIKLPAKWSTKMDEKADSTSGILSILFMAFTLVLVSFSCTGPIIGTLLVEVSSRGEIIAPAIGMFGFALALSIPFSLFAIFPTWLKAMPKSGGWLNTVKVVLAFLELALAFKFLSVADLAYGWGILDREVFLSLWIVIFSLLGFYLIGKLRFPHDSETKHTSVSGIFMGIISFAFAVYMIPGLWGAPLKAVSAFSPPISTQDFNLYQDDVHPQFTDYDAGMKYAASIGKPVIVDFTGFGCVNCRKMEVAVWTDPEVSKILNQDYVLISLYVDDKQPLKQPYDVIENGKTVHITSIGDKWSYLQRSKFGANAQPYYVQLNDKGMPTNTFYKFDENPENFIKWLKK